MTTLSGHTATICAVAASPDGKQFATASDDNTVVIWDLKSHLKLMTYQTENGSGPLAYDSKGKLLALVDGTKIKVIDLETRQQIACYKGHKERINAVAFSPIDERVASVSNDGSVDVWDGRHGSTLFSARKRERLLCLAISPDGNCLAVGSWGGEVVFYNISRSATELNLSQELITTETSIWAHDLPVISLSFKFDGKVFASASIDSTVKVWNKFPQYK